MAHKITEVQQEYVEWKLDPDHEPTTKVAWAKDHGVHAGTLRTWEKEAWYDELVRERMRELHLSTDHLAAVAGVLYQTAIGGGRDSVQAAKAYVALLDRIDPIKAAEDIPLEDVSDEELERLWREG